MKRLLISSAMTLLVGPAYVADICEAVALHDVPAVENPESILERGERDPAISGYGFNKEIGQYVFCSHGGYCYPAAALRLLNCKIGERPQPVRQWLRGYLSGANYKGDYQAATTDIGAIWRDNPEWSLEIAAHSWTGGHQ